MTDFPDNDLLKHESARRHAHHPPKNDRVVQAHETIRGLFTALTLELHDVVPQSRELSLVLTKLDEARMWANAGVALNQERVR